MPLASPPEEDRLLLSTLPASRAQARLALGVALALVAALVATAPFAERPLDGTSALLPAYAAAVLVNELITAALLLAMYAVQQSRSLLVLAGAYLFSGLLVIPWGLTFPGALSATGLLDAGLQSTATIAAARRVGFPLLLLIYGLTRRSAAPQNDPGRPVRGPVLATIAAALAAVCGITLLAVAGEPLMPRWMADSRQVAAAWQYVPPAAILLSLAAAATLWTSRPRSVLDLWLLIVLLTALIEILLLAYLGASRFSLGWWAGRLYGLTSSSVVLVVLLSETVKLYVRLARSLVAERRTREARLATLEALSASIAHEVNQPLGSMVTNADAALRWLDRAQPDLGEARLALKRIASDGHRAGKVIQSVRTMYRKDQRERGPLDLNALVDEALTRAVNDARPRRVVVQAALDAALPPVTGDAVQLQQVIANLLGNAFDALGGSERPPVLRVTTGVAGAGAVMVSVEDNGGGISPEIRQKIFQPFFTTKPGGMGMGLLFCRAVVEAHGGRLWLDEGRSGGALFRFTLPADVPEADVKTELAR